LSISTLNIGSYYYTVTASNGIISQVILTYQSFAVFSKTEMGKAANGCVPYAQAYTINDQFAVPVQYLGQQSSDSMLQIAISQIGYHEGTYESSSCVMFPTSNNWTKYGQVFGWGIGQGSSYAWCAAFVDWVALRAGMLTSVVPKGGFVSNLYNGYVAKGKFHYSNNYTPKPGDTILYFNGTSWYHTGIVESVNKTTVTTIEGNSGNMVKINSHSLAWSDIGGYGSNS